MTTLSPVVSLPANLPKITRQMAVGLNSPTYWLKAPPSIISTRIDVATAVADIDVFSYSSRNGSMECSLPSGGRIFLSLVECKPDASRSMEYRFDEGTNGLGLAATWGPKSLWQAISLHGFATPTYQLQVDELSDGRLKISMTDETDITNKFKSAIMQPASLWSRICGRSTSIPEPLAIMQRGFQEFISHIPEQDRGLFI